MKFTKTPKEPKKTPEEAYAEQISTLSESELRDLHKDLKIDHYGNSTAALINTAAGVGLLSMRSTTRRYRTECMQIEAMEARMKEMGWTPHPNRYRDAVPIALGVAAGTTSGMSFGLINVEKNAKRTKEYVKKTDLFKTKEVVETGKEHDDETEEVDVVEMVQAAEASIDDTQAPEKSLEPIVVEHSIARKPVPAGATDSEAATSQPESLSSLVENPIITEDSSAVAPSATNTAEISQPESPTIALKDATVIEPSTTAVTAETDPTKTHIPTLATPPPTEPNTAKKTPLFSQVSAMNKKMLSFGFKKDKQVHETTVSVTEIACDAPSLVADADADADAVVGHGAVQKLDNPPLYAAATEECVA